MAFCSTTGKTFWCNIWDIFMKAGCKKYRYLIHRSAEKHKIESVAMRGRVCLRMSRVIRESFRGEGVPVARRVLHIWGASMHRLEGGERGRWNAGRYAAYYSPISVMSFARAKWLRTSKGGIFPDGKACPPPARKGDRQGDLVRAVLA